MNIVYASDDRFVPIMLCSIVSLIKKCDNLAFFILSDDISTKNEKKIRTLIEKNAHECNFIDISIYKDELGNRLNVSSSWPQIAFVRLYLEKILPLDIKKVLYLDCDTIALEDISLLDEIDMDNIAVAGSLDCMDINYKEKIGLLTNDNYFNSGVLLYNLEFIRKNCLSNKIEQLINERGKVFKYPDQDVINVAFRGFMKILPNKYNVISQQLGFSYENYVTYRNSDVYYNKDEFVSSVDSATIIHFTSGFGYSRPWYEKCDHPCADLFRQYYVEVNGNMEYWGTDNRSFIQRVVSRVYSCFPRLMMPVLRLLRYINNR